MILSLKDEFYERVRSCVLLEFVSKKAKHFNPNTITLAGLTFAILAGLLFAYKIIFCAVIFVIISSLLDLLDGAVARANKPTKFGGVLDSVSDRYSDAAIMVGIMWGYSFNLSALWFLVGFFAIVGSIMVSYTRAKGESVINEKITIGIADRPARTGLIIIGAIFGCMNYAILSVVFLTHFTVLQRMQFIRKKLKQNSG